MLHPSLQSRAAIDRLRARWSERRNLRIEPFLDQDIAQQLAVHLRGEPYAFRAAEPSRFNFQYWELEVVPHADCDHPRCAFGRWLWRDGAAWLGALTGMDLAPPPDKMMVSTLYDKGCYLEPHSDSDGDRRLAFVLGLTPQPRDEQGGGHLEFLEAIDGRVQVGERRAAAWNSLDVFDVRSHGFVHQVSLVTEPSERRALSGWFWNPASQ